MAYQGGPVSHVNKGIFDVKPLARERNGGLPTCVTLGKSVPLPSLFPARENGDKINLSTSWEDGKGIEAQTLRCFINVRWI